LEYFICQTGLAKSIKFLSKQVRAISVPLGWR